MTTKPKDTIYLDDNCAMCTQLGTLIKKYECDILVKRNSSLNLPDEIKENTVVCFDASKKLFYFEFLAIFFAFSKSRFFVIRNICNLLISVYNVLSLRSFYYYISRKRKLFFKKNKFCNLEVYDD